jgi:hypothetical protein
MMITAFIPEHRCPCGQISDASSGTDGHNPEPGHISVCINCGVLTVFAEDMTQRPPTAKELTEYQADPIWKRIKAIQHAILLHGRSNGLGQ